MSELFQLLDCAFVNEKIINQLYWFYFSFLFKYLLTNKGGQEFII